MQCFNCGKDNLSNVNFCIDCGNQLHGVKIDYLDKNKKYFTQTIILFLCIVLLILMSLRDFLKLSFLSHEYFFNGALIIITIVFLIFDYKNFFKLFKIKLRLSPLIKTTILAPSLAFIVIIIANYINSAFSVDNTKYYLGYQLYTSNMYLYGILFVSIMPGFIEEMLFRGILFNHLLRFTSPKVVIIISSILFAFIHFSLISIIWLFCIGLILGYFRFRYRTIWYSIYFHCLYNASVFIFDFYI